MMVLILFQRFATILFWVSALFMGWETPKIRADEPLEKAEKTEPYAVSMVLSVGQRYPIEGVIPDSISVDPPGYISVHQSPAGVILQGLKKGHGTLHLMAHGRKADLQFEVKESGLASKTISGGYSQELLKELKRHPSLRLQTLADRTVIEGVFLNRSLYLRTLLLQAIDPKNWLLLALPDRDLQKTLVTSANHTLTQRGFSGVSIQSAGNRYFLEGTVTSPLRLEQALSVARSTFANIENHVGIPFVLDPTVYVRIYMLELSKNAHDTLGLGWPASSSGGLFLSPQETIFNPSWSITFKHLSQRGEARVLAEPSLVIRNQATAELSAGGEIPLRITGQFDNRVIWRHYGLRIKIQIAGVSGSTIRTKIQTESSQLDESTSIDGIPGIRSNQLDTEVDAESGRAILLTGLFQATAAKDVEKLPILGDIPILGELFKSRRFREHQSELLIAMVPSFGAPHTQLPLASTRGLEFDKHWGLRD